MNTFKKILKIFYRTAAHSSVYFTVWVLFLISIAAASVEKSASVYFLSVSSCFNIMLFALILGTADNIFFIKKLNVFIAACIHAVIAILDFILVFGILRGNTSTAESTIPSAVVFFFIYVICIALYLVSRMKEQRDKNDASDYKPIFKS